MAAVGQETHEALKPDAIATCVIGKFVSSISFLAKCTRRV